MTGGARRLRLDLAYDGTEFAGWQLQPGQRTVQGTLEVALSRLAGERQVRLHGAGRTDAGVHARCQVATCDFAGEMNDREIQRALTGMLPRDLRALAVRTVAAEFDACRDAQAKTYRYRLDRSPHGDPFLARYALHHPQPLDPGLLRLGLERLPGRRDWSGFAAAGCEIRDRVRTLSVARLDEPDDDQLALTFTADGFLMHMVRNLVGTLLAIARGRFGVERIDEVLEAGDRRLAGPTAPARGLCLERVDY